MALRTPLTAQPHLYIGDSTGRPLDYGRVYFGEPNRDPEFYPIDIYLDPEMTIAAAQPVRTKGGFMDVGGNLAELHAAEVIYSLKVLDRYGRQVFYKPEMYRNNVSDFLVDEITRATAAENLITGNLTAETQRAIAAEKVIATAVVTEKDRAVAAEVALDVKHAALSSTINSLGGGKKAYTTYALMVADKNNIAANSSIDVTNDTDPLKNGTYSYDGAVFAKSIYDVETIVRTKVLNTFETKALMDASVLPDGALAIVYNDKTVVDGKLDVNNGLYSKSAGNFVRTTYDVSAKINVVDEAIFKTISLITGKDFTLSDGYFLNTGQLVKDGSRGYQYSSPIALKRGDIISFEFYGAGITALLKTNQDITTGTSLIVIGGTDETTKRFAEYKATSDMLVSICSRTSQGALQPKLKTKNVLESDALKDVSQSFDDIQEFVSPKEPIGVATNLGGFNFKDIVQLAGAAGIDSVDVILSKGDVLTYDYQPVAGTNLWDWVGNTGYPLLSFIEGSIAVKSHRFVATNAMTARITNAVKSSIKVNGVVKSGTDVLGWAAKLTATYSIDNTYLVFRVSLPFSLNKGDTIVITKVAIGGVSLITTTGGTTPTRTSLYARNAASDDTSPFEWTADAYCLVQVCGMADSDFYIRRKTSFTLDERITSLAGSGGSGGGGGDDGSVPDFMTLPARENVFATSMNYILKTELIDNVDYIKISTDLGKTWTQMPNILGDILSYHFFSDGTIMLCSPTKVYWTRDYLTLNESAVFDHDGSVFVPTGRHFFTMQTGDSVQYIDNQEIFVFADYLTGIKPRLWYSLDRGRTIKCAALFGTTVMDGSVRDITHVHRVYYHKKSQTFYITTGDYGDGNLIMKAVYNVATDTWTWDVLATGIEYKFGNITIDDNNIAYIVTDYEYREPSLADKKGIYRVPVSDLGDITKYQRIYHADAVTWGNIAPLLLIMDKNGNKVLLPDYLGKGFIWVARDGLDFVKVRLSEDVLLQYAVGANYKGDIYCIDYYGNGGQWRLNRGSFNLTKMLKDAGVSDFMNGTTIIPNLPDIF